MEEKTVCYWKFIGSKFLKDFLYIGKWGLVIVSFGIGILGASFIGAWIGANFLATVYGTIDWILSQGNLVLWGIVALYVFTTLALKLYQGAPSDCWIPWVIGLVIFVIAYIITLATESPLPVPQLLILILWGPVLFGMRYAWLMHTAAVRYCEEQAVSQEIHAAARVDQRMV
jgi:hypothetical protein